MLEATESWKKQGGSLWRDVWPSWQLDFELLASKTEREYISVALIQVWGGLLQQSQETNSMLISRAAEDKPGGGGQRRNKQG